jgi:hypothetical protein
MYAVVVEVDNREEDPEEGRRGLREELAPAMRMLPGFVSATFMTAHERGVGIGVVILQAREDVEHLAMGFVPGAELRPGVRVTRTEVLEVAARA